VTLIFSNTKLIENRKGRENGLISSGSGQGKVGGLVNIVLNKVLTVTTQNITVFRDVTPYDFEKKNVLPISSVKLKAAY
jgi:hypothetical protein